MSYKQTDKPNHIAFILDNKQMACYGIDGVKICLKNSAENLIENAKRLKDLHLPTNKEARLKTVHDIQTILNTLINEYDHIDRDLRAYEKFLDMFED